jgi:hypothetical protein
MVIVTVISTLIRFLYFKLYFANRYQLYSSVAWAIFTTLHLLHKL